MRDSTLQRLTAWLCLAALTLMGVAPAGRLVLCFGPDGSVALEAAVEGDRCPGCSEAPASREADEAAAIPRGEEGCPCLDVPVLGDAQRVAPRAVRIDLAAAMTEPSPASRSGWLRADEAAPRAPAPRPALALTLIRSVVLRV